MKELINPEYETLIFTIRGKKVMLDADLALLYDVATKVLKQQVKRNIERFPEDFMFELTKSELINLRSQSVTSSFGKKESRWGGVRYLPYAFTEQGVAMLSSVLHSRKSIQINIEIMRAFARYRAIIKENENLKKEINDLDEKLNSVFKFLLDKIDALHQVKNEPRNPIGYKVK